MNEKVCRKYKNVATKMLCDSDRIFKRALSRMRFRNFLTCYLGVFMRISNFKCKFGQEQLLVAKDYYV